MENLNASSDTTKHQSVLYAVQNYGKRLYRFIRSRVNNDEDAEDILQDVWYQLSSIIDTEPIDQMSGWLYRVSKNKIIDRNKKHKTLSLEDFAYEAEDGQLVFPDVILSDALDAGVKMDTALLRELFFKALDELPEKQRQVFVWNEMEDMTLQQIADQTGESIKTIISRKRYAVARLREQLQDIYDELLTK
ncbi:RNA polymerase sigma factor [Paludibacter jiangxiensis]|uniref:RNA polymerase sigma factor, sigma-70 family n=1 Tax=Paludibacter jiangxiensis TaxID=681398 RepID=A0A170ZF85_9BACT|nr:sigma-70 family RNA polymerase sigma factor [Paludibacter jiangxiensis]GAT62612.1 RNA polymerase sigma factor, sigma-70 family [Paludibacter jiangxiensis]